MHHTQAKPDTPKTLLIGIGNSGRRDDGLGWAFLDAIREEGAFRGEASYRYQLQVEDAEKILSYDKVIFVDASENKREQGFYWKPCLPVANFGFSTHALDPDSIVALCQELYGGAPEAFVLGIEGEEWELREGLSPAAEANLEKALDFFRESVMKTA